MSDMEFKLQSAAARGRLDEVKRLVEEEGVDPNVNDGVALFCAANFGQTNVVIYLLKKNVSTEFRDRRGDTPLIDAAKGNRLEVVRLLLDANANINAKNKDNKTALYLAFQYSYKDIAQLLRDQIRKANKAKLLTALLERRFSDATSLFSDPSMDVNLCHEYSLYSNPPMDVNLCNDDRVPLLHLVTDTGDMELLQTLLSKPNLDVNATDKDGRTALARAMAKKDVAAIFALLKANARICSVDEEGLVIETDIFGSLLLHAASTNNASNVEVLLRAGVRPATTNKDGATALHVAAANGYDAIAQLLLAKTASLSIYSDHRGNLPLHLAAANGHLTVVDRLLKDSTLSGLNCTNNEGWSPLTVAVQSGHAPVVSRFLASGALLDYTASNGWTLLHAAAATGSLKVIQALLSTQLNIFAKTTAGETPLMIATQKQRPNIILQAFRDIEAAEHQRFLDAVRSGEKAHVDSLLKKGVNVDTKDATGRSALHVAASLDHSSVALLLVAAGATIDAALANGQTALHTAASANSVRAAALLVVAGANLDATDLDRRQPLHVAAMQGHDAVAQCLLERGADIHALDGAKMTPLHHAAMKGSGAVVKLLLEANASVSAQNKKGATPLALAKQTKNEAIVRMMTRHLLLAAVQKKDANALQQLLKAGASTDEHDNAGTPLLHLVIESSSSELLQVMMIKSANVDLNVIDTNERTPLDRAVCNTNVAAALALVLADAVTKQLHENQMRGFVQTYGAHMFGVALRDAIAANDQKRVERLLDLGVSPASTNEKGETSLHVAVTKNHVAFVQLLLAQDATLPQHGDKFGNVPLHLAAACGQVTIVDALLKNVDKSGIDAINNEGDSALVIAVKKGHADVVTRLLQAKASLRYTTSTGWTLLHEAAASGSPKVIQALVETPLNIFAKTTAGETPLKIAIDKQRYKTITKALRDAEAAANQRFLDAASSGDVKLVDACLNKGVDINTTDAKGRTALHVAAADAKCSKVVALLVESGANINMQTTDGWTPLRAAAHNNHVAALKHLLQAGALVHVPSHDVRLVYRRLANLIDVVCKDEALHLAAKQGHVEVVDLLLKAHEAVGTASSTTALHVAVRNKHIKVVKRLLQAGVVASTLNKAGETPLMLAMSNDCTEIASMLAQHLLLAAVRDCDVAALEQLLKLLKATKIDTTDVCDDEGTPLLHVAVDSNSAELLNVLLEASPMLHVEIQHTTQTLGREMPLARALRKKLGHAVAALVAANATVAPQHESDVRKLLDARGTAMLATCLLQAAVRSDKDRVDLLLRLGVPLTAINELGETALHVAASKGDGAIVEMLVLANASLSGCSDQSGNLPLHLAAVHGQMNVVSTLMDATTDKMHIDATNNEGDSALVIAVKKGHADVVTRLLQAKASLRCTTSTGWTLLHEAAASGSPKVIQALVETPLNIFAKTTAGETPLKIAIDKKHADDVLQAFRDAEAAANRRFLDAVSSGDVELVDAYLKKGVDINTTDAKGRTALHVAVTNNHADVVEQLVRGGATLVVCDAAGTSPLFLAAQQDKAAMADVLLKSFEAMATCIRLSYAEAVDKGHKAVAEVLFPHLQQRVADPDPEADRAAKKASRDALLSIFRVALGSANSEATLVKAVLKGHVDAVQCLLAMGADPTTMRPEQEGWTLLALAIRQANDAVAQVLYPYLYPGPTAATGDELKIEGTIFSSHSVTVHKGMYGDKAVVTKGPRFPSSHDIEHFMEEINTMRTCTSPYLLPLLAVLDNGSHEPHFVPPETFVYSPTMVMEYMELGDLFQHLRKKRYKIPVQMEFSTIEVALVVALALADLHRRKVIHRDVKSLNIFLSKTHYIRLGDLGSARTLDATQVMTSNAGTTNWIAPEVLRVPGREGQGRAYTSAADIYSFGVVLTELETRDVPYHDVVGPERVSILTKVLAGELRPTMSATCPLWLHTLANQCMAFDPTKRPTADAIVQELLLRRHDDAPASTDGVLAPSPNGSVTA